MIRNIVLGLLVAPPVAALAGVVLLVVAMLFGLGMPSLPSGNVARVATGFNIWAVIGPLLFMVIGAYMFGWIPALLLGIGNGILAVLPLLPRLRLALAPVVGALAVVAYFAWLFGAKAFEPRDLLNLGLLSAAAAIASLVTAAMAMRLKRAMDAEP